MGTEQETLIVTIEDIAPKQHFIFVSDRAFRMLPSTVILDRDGNTLSYKALGVPCKARITFRLFGNNRHPLVTRIVRLD